MNRNITKTASLIAVGRMVSIFCGLATTVLIARYLTADEFGYYSIIISTVLILGIPAQVGLPEFMHRETARERARNFPNLRDKLRWAHRITGYSTVAIFAITAVVLCLQDTTNTIEWTVWLIAALLVPAQALSAIRAGILRGAGFPVASQAPELYIRPIIFLLIVAALYFSKQQQGLLSVMSANVFAWLVAFAFGSYLLNLLVSKRLRKRDPDLPNADNINQERTRWLLALVTLGGIGGLRVISNNLDFVILGWFSDMSTVGAYKIQALMAGYIGFFIQISNVMLSKKVGTHIELKSTDQLQQTITYFANRVSILTLITFLGVILFGNSVIGILFGSEYLLPLPVLVILAIGHLVNSISGSVVLCLNMARMERAVLKTLIVSVAINVVLNCILIPTLGAYGAALATLASMTYWNIVLFFKVRSAIGITTLPFQIGLPNKAKAL